MSPVQTASRPRGHDNLHPANPIAAGANRPPDRVLPCLRGGDLALNPREQLFRFREGQSQIGDIAEVIRPADLHDVHAGTLVPGCLHFKIHSTPHPRSKNRSKNIRHALAPPVLHQSHLRAGDQTLSNDHHFAGRGPPSPASARAKPTLAAAFQHAIHRRAIRQSATDDIISTRAQNMQAPPQQRLRSINVSAEANKPSVCRSGSLNAARNIRLVWMTASV